MALKKNARYAFGLHYLRLRAVNDDLSIPTADNIVGGAGPFDYSGVDSIAAVPMTIKIDDAAAVDVDIDLAAAVDETAVTVDELVTALTAAFTAGTIALTAEKDVTSGRLVIAHATATVLQVYGEAAELAMIGQGFGVKLLVSDTMQSFSQSPVRKEGERITTTDAWGFDTEVITDGYYKGFTANLVDTAEDWEMLGLLEGTPIDADGNISSPVFSTKRPVVMIEAFYAKYRKGQNYEGDLVGYRKITCDQCKGMGGEKTRERGWSNDPYTIEGKTWVDSDGVEHPAWKREELTVAAFNALDIENV